MPERILIIDDDADSREFLALTLESAGYATSQAGDGASGLAAALGHPPDLILLDVIMPGQDGYAVCAAIKADPDLAAIPVIFLSAQSRIRDKIKGLEAGGADYVTKPFDEGEVVARVRSQLRIRALSRDLEAANSDLRRKQERIDADLRTAGDIQRALLPPRPPEHPELDTAWRFIPSQAVGGDIFDILPLGCRHLAFYMLDVSGHGIASALVAVSVSQAMTPHGGLILSPDADLPMSARINAPEKVLARLDQIFPMERFDKYFTMFYMVLSLDTGEIAYSRAAHPPAILCRASGECLSLEEGGSLIGLGEGQTFQGGRIVLQPGDRLFIFTDGLSEYENPVRVQFGLERLEQALLRATGADMDASLENVMNGVRLFGQGAPPRDDISILGLTWRGHG